MCIENKCPTCGKTSWIGCGDHKAEVMAKVPLPAFLAGTAFFGDVRLIVREWCVCPRGEGEEYPPGILRPRRTPEQRAADRAAGL